MAIWQRALLVCFTVAMGAAFSCSDGREPAESFARGYLVDGTGFELVTRTPLGPITELGGVLVVQGADGPRAVGIHQYLHEPDVPRTPVASACGWSLDVDLYEGTLTVDALRESIDARCVDGFPIFAASGPIAFAAPKSLPSEVSVSFDGVRVERGCRRGPVVTCSDDETLMATGLDVREIRRIDPPEASP